MTKTHVFPRGDLREHNIIDGDRCWCSPTEDGDVIIHHSLDGREDYEEGRRKLN